MKSLQRLSVIAATLVFSVSLARGQERPDPSVSCREDCQLAGAGDVDRLHSQFRQSGRWFETDGPTCRRRPFPSSASLPAGSRTRAATASRRFRAACSREAAGRPQLRGRQESAGIPAMAQALSLNFTVVRAAAPGFLMVLPDGSGPVPLTAILNFNCRRRSPTTAPSCRRA